MKTLITIAVIIFIIYNIVKWLNKNEKKDDTTDEPIESTSEDNEIHIRTVEEIERNLIKRINCSAVGLDFERNNNKTGRQILTKLVNELKREDGLRYEKYEGLTNKEIIEDYFTDRIYELSTESIPACILEKEDDNEYDSNAIKVLVGNKDDELYHIGYVPKEHCKEIRQLMSQYRVLTGSTIYGGKYKYVDFDDYGEEKVIIDSTEYGLHLSISFWKD